tara:strand:+ start:240 stop:566 length:327 start_codon:yes stop_codon:yes gene_type:complete
MKKTIDLNKEKVKDHCLNWTASDVAYKVELLGKYGAKNIIKPFREDYKIIDEPTEEQREDLQGIMQDAIYENQDMIIEVINDALWDYMIENKGEIMETLIDNKYIKRQ